MHAASQLAQVVAISLSDPSAFRVGFFAKCVLGEVWEEGEMLLLDAEGTALGCDRRRGCGCSAYICWQLHPLHSTAVREEQRKTARKTEEKKRSYQLAVSSILCPKALWLLNSSRYI